MTAASTSPAQEHAASIATVDRLDLRFAPRAWPFAVERRSEIDAFFAERQKQRSGLWNGQVLLLGDFAIEQSVFRGNFFDTDYAALHAWASWGFTDEGIKNGFAVGALQSADGAFVLGEMAGHTANAGQIYFPSGTPDLRDVTGTRVDFADSLRREIQEEIGVAESDYVSEPGWFVVCAGPHIALLKFLRARENAATLSRRITAHLAREAQPELAGVRMVRSPTDFAPGMLVYAKAFLLHYWRNR